MPRHTTLSAAACYIVCRGILHYMRDMPYHMPRHTMPHCRSILLCAAACYIVSMSRHTIVRWWLAENGNLRLFFRL